MPKDCLIEITSAEYSVDIDLIYATDRNITGKPIYQAAHCLLLTPAEAGLRKAIELAGKANLKLKIFDAYRPPEAQQALWNFLPDPTYIADISLGSNHSRGTAIDLTLVGADGVDLEMGTGFDDMTEASAHFYTDHPANVQRNRLLLLGLMHASGFTNIASEWWHYELPNARSFPLIANAESGALRLM